MRCPKLGLRSFLFWVEVQGLYHDALLESSFYAQELSGFIRVTLSKEGGDAHG